MVSTDLALSFCQFLDVSFLSRNELMKRRIQETDGNRVALQSLVQLPRSRPADTAGSSPELLLSLQQCQSRSSHGKQSILSPSKNICSVRQRPIPSAPSSRAFLASAGVSALVRTFMSSELISPSHDTAELTSDRSVYSRDCSVVDVTG